MVKLKRGEITLKDWKVGNSSANVAMGQVQYIKYVSTPYSRRHIAVIAELKSRPEQYGALDDIEVVKKTKEIAKLIAYAPEMKALLEEELEILSSLMITISGLHEVGIRTKDKITKRQETILAMLNKLK